MNFDIKKRIDLVNDTQIVTCFFELIKSLINKGNISEEDKRLSLTLRNDDLRRFSVNINGRLVLAIVNSYELALMVNTDDFSKISGIDILQTEDFKKNISTKLVYLRFDEVQRNLKVLRELWLRSCLGYLPSQEKSQYRLHHVDELLKIAIYDEIRQKYFDSTFAVYTNFQQIIRDFTEYINNENSVLINFKIQKLYKSYVWIWDPEIIIGDPRFCHYELITRKSHRNKISIELHFNPEFKNAIKNLLAENLDEQFYWNYKHGDELSLALQHTVDFNDPDLLPKLSEGIKLLDDHFGEIVRNFFLDKYPSENINYLLIDQYKKWYQKEFLIELDGDHALLLYGFLYQLEKNELLSAEQINSCAVPILKIIKEKIKDFDYDGLNIFESFLDYLITKKQMKNIALNQILYGPSGTGKTYNTINKSLSIIEDKSEEEINKENREVLKSRFDNYVKNGRIVFTTFHQSMSYEDFVEGIKPIMNEDEGELSYEVQNGIFKEICKNTNEINETVADNFEVCWNKLIVLIKEKIADNKLLKIGNWEYGLSSKDSLKYSSLNSPSQYTFTITKQNIQDVYQNKQARPSGAFQKDMEDIVKYIKENFGLPDYNYKDEKNTGKNQNKNFVLIIDEINRGNVSQIFGELFTLIEESKRIGNEEELKVTLPYSKKEFGVPSNLYIIGTMNTADRSIEALDTALRRRFCFEEMLPKPNLLNDMIIGTVKLDELLTTINKRIEVLLDRDHTIGHSYFINVKTEQDLRNTFKTNIIPLLQEYFYGDYEKIGMILGIGFFDEQEKYDNKFFAAFPTQNYPEGGNIFRLKTIDDNFNIINAINILSGNNSNQ